MGNVGQAGLGTDEECLIEILCTREASEVQEIRRAYREANPKSDLEADLISETSGSFKVRASVFSSYFSWFTASSCVSCARKPPAAIVCLVGTTLPGHLLQDTHQHDKAH
jgi:hypothetical protein